MIGSLTSPILRYELERAAKAKRWFILRFGYIAALLAVELVGLFLAEMAVSPSRPAETVYPQLGRTLFHVFTIAMGAAVVIVTPAFAGGLIAIEKERKTLGLLFVTALTEREIIQHKLLSQAIILASTLLAPVPILFVCLVFGGVDWLEMLCRFCLIISTFFFCCGVGIFASAISPDTGAANKIALALTWLILLIPPGSVGAATLIAQSAAKGSELARYATQFGDRMWAAAPYFNPPIAAYVLTEKVSNVAGSVPGASGWIVCSLLGIAAFWVGIYGASLALRDRAAVLDVTARRWALFPGAAALRRGRPTQQVWDNPVLWREAHSARTLRWVLWLLLGMGLFLVVMGFAAVKATDEWYHWIAIVVETFVLFARVIDRGASAFAGEREKGTLDLVLLTQLTPVQIFWGKIAGVVRGTMFFWLLPTLHAATAFCAGIFDGIVVMWTALNTLVFGGFFLVATLTISAKSDTRRSAGRRTLLMLAGILISPVTALFFGPLALVLSPTVWVCAALSWSKGGSESALFMLGHAASLVLYAAITMGAARSLWEEIEQGLAPTGWAPAEMSARGYGG
ncbi:MAG: ABC transporter permease subunit [Planctomycetota bacterium]